MNNLDDLYYFARVVEHGGYSSASRMLGIPKSRLSRRVAALEERIGVNLINRSTRQFSVTEFGHEFYRHCLDLTAAAEAAQAAVEERTAEPRGVVKLSCPTALLNFLVTGMIARYTRQYPNVEIHLESTNRQVDVLREGFDFALRVDVPPIPDSELVMKRLSSSPQQLVVSPALLQQIGGVASPDELDRFPSLSSGASHRGHEWHLEGPGGSSVTVKHRPRLITDDMITLRRVALEGGGIVQLPTLVIFKDIKFGHLVPVLPGWAPRAAVVNAVFPSRRGQLPSVRSLLDYLAENFGELDFTNLYDRYVTTGDEDACILTGHQNP